MNQVTQFSCVNFPEFMKMSASIHQSVTRSERIHSKNYNREYKTKMIASVASFGYGVDVMSKITLSIEYDSWEQQKFDLEMKTIELDGVIHNRQHSLKGRRFNELDEKNRDGKLQCNGVNRSKTSAIK